MIYNSKTNLNFIGAKMFKYLCLLMAILGVSDSLSADCVAVDRSRTSYELFWPTMPKQETPDNEAFCADNGAIWAVPDASTMTKTIGMRSFFTNKFVGSTIFPTLGYYQAHIFLELTILGSPPIIITSAVDAGNYLNGIAPCRISDNGATLPNQTTFVYAPNLDGDIVRDVPHGRIIVQDNFLYGPVNPETGRFDNFTNIRNNDFATPGANPTIVTLDYYRVANITDCAVYNDNFGPKARAEVLKLEDILDREFTLPTGEVLTGAEIKKMMLGK